MKHAPHPWMFSGFVSILLTANLFPASSAQWTMAGAGLAAQAPAAIRLADYVKELPAEGWPGGQVLPSSPRSVETAVAVVPAPSEASPSLQPVISGVSEKGFQSSITKETALILGLTKKQEDVPSVAVNLKKKNPPMRRRVDIVNQEQRTLLILTFANEAGEMYFVTEPGGKLILGIGYTKEKGVYPLPAGEKTERAFNEEKAFWLGRFAGGK